jgi:hypothetical protein
MNNFLEKIRIPDGWILGDSSGLPDCVVLRHGVFGVTTINIKRRIYAAGDGLPNPQTCTMTYKGKGWEQSIVNHATARNESFWSSC